MIKVVEDSFLSDILAHRVMRLFFSDNSFMQSEYADFMQRYGQLQESDLIICSVKKSIETHDFLASHNFQHMGTHVFLTKKSHEQKKVMSCDESLKIIACITPYTIERSWLPGLQELACQIGQTSHFAQNISLGNVYKKIYNQWLINTFAGYAHIVWVAQEKNDLAGLISLRRRNNEFMIDLLGVREKYRRRGIAGLLLKQAIEYVKVADCDMTVCTQGENVPALTLYEQWGFSGQEQLSVYHAYTKRSADEQDRITYRSGRIHRQ